MSLTCNLLLLILQFARLKVMRLKTDLESTVSSPKEPFSWSFLSNLLKEGKGREILSIDSLGSAWRDCILVLLKLFVLVSDYLFRSPI